MPEKGFDLDTYTEEQSKASFRFYKDDIRNLCVELGIPREFRARNGTALSGEEGLCVLLKRLSYPNRLGDLSEIFGRSISELSYTFNGILDFVDNAHSHLLTDLNQTWLSPANLQVFADAIHAGGAPLENCWGFIDGTVRPICRPTQNQRFTKGYMHLNFKQSVRRLAYCQFVWAC